MLLKKDALVSAETNSNVCSSIALALSKSLTTLRLLANGPDLNS